MRLTLLSSHAGSLGPGDPLLYRGFRVGRVEDTVFDEETQQVRSGRHCSACSLQLAAGSALFLPAARCMLHAQSPFLSSRHRIHPSIHDMS